MNREAFERWVEEENLQAEDAQLAWRTWQAAVRAERIRLSAIVDGSKHRMALILTEMMRLMVDEVNERPISMPRLKK
jgi:hypothetical protein